MPATSEHPVTAEAAPSPPAGPRPAPVRLLRIVGWALIVAGAVALLYVVHALWFTGLGTERAQQELREGWQQGEVGGDDASGTFDGQGAAVAMLEFVRPGSERSPVGQEPLFVVDGVSFDDLTRGPGRYPGAEAPGETGNFAVAGHRTTYDAPFYSLDELRAGDEVHVTDRSGTRHVYEFRQRRIVEPTAQWVLGDDPLDVSGPTLTLTTCHPRLSAAERMVVFAELAS